MADVPNVRPTPLHLWDEDGLGTPDISEVAHLKTVDRVKRTANGDPVIVFTDASTITPFAPLVRSNTYVPLTMLYREKVARGRPVPDDRLAKRKDAERRLNAHTTFGGVSKVAAELEQERKERTDGNVQRDAPVDVSRYSTQEADRILKEAADKERDTLHLPSRPRPHAGSTTRKKSPSRNKG